jgi:hypothetical protein
MNSKSVTYVSMDLIANKILRHPMMKSLNYEDIIDHSVTVLKLIKVPGVYKETSYFARIENHLVKIPSEALNLKKVEFVHDNGSQTPMVVSSNSLSKQAGSLAQKSAYQRACDAQLENNREIRTDPSLSSENKSFSVSANSPIPEASSFKYAINNQHVVCSMMQGTAMLVYDVINADENGIPLVPNSESVIKAITNYIKVQVFEVLVDMNKISERSLTRAEQEYSWYIGQAQTEFQGIGSEDEMESFLNNHIGLFNTSSLHSDRYESSSDKEVINIL